MGGRFEPAYETLTGLCPASVSKLLSLGYIQPAKAPGTLRSILGVYVLTEKGREALMLIVNSIPDIKEMES